MSFLVRRLEAYHELISLPLTVWLSYRSYRRQPRRHLLTLHLDVVFVGPQMSTEELRGHQENEMKRLSKPRPIAGRPDGSVLHHFLKNVCCVRVRVAGGAAYTRVGGGACALSSNDNGSVAFVQQSSRHGSLDMCTHKLFNSVMTSSCS